MFKSILTWIVRIGFGGELGEEKDSVYHKKRLCLPLSSTLRERECRGLVGKLPAVNGLRLWPTGPIFTTPDGSTASQLFVN